MRIKQTISPDSFRAVIQRDSMKMSRRIASRLPPIHQSLVVDTVNRGPWKQRQRTQSCTVSGTLKMRSKNIFRRVCESCQCCFVMGVDLDGVGFPQWSHRRSFENIQKIPRTFFIDRDNLRQTNSCDAHYGPV